MRLGFYYHVPAVSKGGRILTPGYQGRFLDSLAQYCDSVTCFLHHAPRGEIDLMDYAISSPNVKWVDIGPRRSVPVRAILSAFHTRAVSSSRASLDAVLIRGSTALLPAVAVAARPLPIALLLVGDHLAGVDDLPQPRWRKEAIRTWWRWNKLQQIRVAERSLTFVNSHALFKELEFSVANLVETRTTTLNERDFFDREDTCAFRPYRLLFAGRMSRIKGLFDILDALALLVDQGEDVVFDLVGMPEKGENTLEELDRVAARKGLSARIKYHGYKPVGPELFAYYRRADVYVIASQSSFEGFPRAIWEAMAHSLPVVATNVGSIPYYLVHREHALIVPPHSPILLAGAIQTLIHSKDLRRTLIRNGFLLARDNTLERRTPELVTRLEQYVEGKKAQLGSSAVA